MINNQSTDTENTHFRKSSTTGTVLEHKWSNFLVKKYSLGFMKLYSY